MLIQPLLNGFHLTPDLVRGEDIEYACLDGAFLTHCRLRWWRIVLWNQWLDAQSLLQTTGPFIPKIRDSLNNFSDLAFMDGH